MLVVQWILIMCLPKDGHTIHAFCGYYNLLLTRVDYIESLLLSFADIAIAVWPFELISVYFADQFLSIGTTLPPNYNLYGLGEHKSKLRLQYVPP